MQTKKFKLTIYLVIAIFSITALTFNGCTHGDSDTDKPKGGDTSKNTPPAAAERKLTDTGNGKPVNETGTVPAQAPTTPAK